MIKISPLERFHMYNASIEILKNQNKRTICTSLRQTILAIKNRSVPVQNIEDYFPELKNKLPLKKGSNYEHRIDILIECVKSIDYENV